MSGVGASQMILAAQVGLGDFKIMQGHVGTLVAEEFHDGGQGDASAQHLRGTMPRPELCRVFVREPGFMGV
jgi:hypothetical protein